MGKIDTITKEYMKNPIVFADAFNQFLYHGEKKIDPAQLTELDTTEIVIPYGTNGVSVPEQHTRALAHPCIAERFQLSENESSETVKQYW